MPLPDFLPSILLLKRKKALSETLLYYCKVVREHAISGMLHTGISRTLRKITKCQPRKVLEGFRTMQDAFKNLHTFAVRHTTGAFSAAEAQARETRGPGTALTIDGSSGYTAKR